jgi:peptide/nickel transport system substrate-binding protein
MDETRWHRRGVLSGAIGATGVAVSLAGCGQEDPTENQSGNGGESGTVDSDRTLRIPTNASNPNDLQWNKYFTQGSGAGSRFMYDPMALPGNYPRGVDATDFPDWHNVLAEDFTTEGRTLTITLRDDYTWHDGDPVLAEDVLLQYRLESAIGARTGGVWEEIAAPDDRTIEFTLNSANSDISLPQLLPTNIRVKRGTAYEDLYEAIESATTDDERDQAKGKVTTTRIENSVGTGLWKVDGTSANQLTFARHDGHPMADALNFDRLEMPAVPNNQKRHLGLEAGEFDALVFATAPKTVEEGFPDHVERIPYVSSAGDTLLFNFDGVFGDRRVRQAITFVINRWTNTHNAKDFVDTIRYPTGLPNRVMEEWIGEDPEGFYQYGYKETKGDRAAELLRDAGFSRDDGEWYTPDDERFSFQIISGSGGTWKLNNQTASATLSNFGIQADARVMEGAAFGERVQQGDFAMAVNAWGAFGGGWHPYNFFSQEFEESDNERQHIDPTSVEVPYPVGDPDGDLQTVDVTAKINALGEADTSEEAEQFVTELAWIYNQYLPRIPLMNGITRRFISRDGWEFPATDSKWMVDNPVDNLMRFGKFRASEN